MSAKAYQYKQRLRLDGGTLEVQFESQENAPRLDSLYVTDSAKFGDYEDGKIVTVAPEDHAAKMAEPREAVEREWGNRQSAAMLSAGLPVAKEGSDGSEVGETATSKALSTVEKRAPKAAAQKPPSIPVGPQT